VTTFLLQYAQNPKLGQWVSTQRKYQKLLKAVRVNPNLPDGGLVENYCRNPDGDKRAWCYTTNPEKRFDYCNVASC
jgi:hypothetical protein